MGLVVLVKKMSVLINFLLQNTNLVSVLSKICPIDVWQDRTGTFRELCFWWKYFFNRVHLDFEKNPFHTYYPCWINHFIGCVSAKYLHSHHLSFTSVSQTYIQSGLFWHRCLERQTFGTTRMYMLFPSKSIKGSNYGIFLKDKNVLLMYTTVLSLTAYTYAPNLESLLTQQYVCVMCTLWSDNTCVFTRFYSVKNTNTQLIWSSVYWWIFSDFSEITPI